MTRAIRRSLAFRTDFENRFAWYFDQAGAEVAWRFQRALDNSLAKLSIQPDLGRPRHFRHRDLAENPFGKLLIFYRANDEVLDALRLIHGPRNLPRRLRE